MSELINNNRTAIRWKLLTSASALALTATLSSANLARAEDASHPPIWITFGGEAMRLTGQGQPFTPPLEAENPNSSAFRPIPPSRTEAFQPFTYDASLGIAFQPENSDWQFAASVQFGRTTRRRGTSELGKPDRFKAVKSLSGYYTGCVTPYSCAGFKHTFTSGYYTAKNVNFSVIQSRQSQTHLILDFQAGKDVGLGIFSSSNTGYINFGVRIAQFTSRSSTDIHARPDLHHVQSEAPIIKIWFPNTYVPWQESHFHTFVGEGSATHGFRGVGPAISWNDSLPVAGNADSGLAVDWGVNMAALFGRRKVTAEQLISGHYEIGGQGLKTQYTHTIPINRRHNVIVPNAGGFAGLSFNYASAKISLGYRGDFFFGAMDTGWDQSRVQTIGLYGPFANLSIGL